MTGMRSRTGYIKFEGDLVRKRFARADQAEQAARELQQLNQLFRVCEYDGYRYQTVGLLAFDAPHNSVVMRRATGLPLSQLALDDVNCRLAGRWIALFQRGIDGDVPGRAVPRFGDFGPVHLFIDHGQRTVTVIDPAATVGVLTVPEEDVGNMCVALVVHALKQGRRPVPAVTAFLEGYIEINPRSLQAAPLRQQLEAPLEQTRRRWLRKGGTARVVARGIFGAFARYTRAAIMRGVKSCNI